MTVPPNLPSASWSLIEYDAAFVTTIPDNKNSKGYVSSAIISGQLFLRSFVRLEEGQRNNMVRSNVLAIDVSHTTYYPTGVKITCSSHVSSSICYKHL